MPTVQQLIRRGLDTPSTSLEKLDARSRDILMARRMDDGNKSTLHELADKYNVSAERIRQLEQSAMKKLRAALEVCVCYRQQKSG